MSILPPNPSHLTAGPLVFELLRAAFPGLMIQDQCFPEVASYWCGEDVEAALDPAQRLSQGEMAFFARFRQAGGHLPVRAGSAAEEVGSTPVALVRRGRGDPALADLPADVTIRVAHRSGPAAWKDPQELYSLQLRFSWPTHHESYGILCHTPLGDWMADRLRHRTVVKDVVQRMPWAVPVVEAVMQAGTENAAVVHTIMADRFIHDGALPSERSGDYSWLWVGAEREVRILLGHVSPRVRRLRVVTPNALSLANLMSMRVSLNGRVVAGHVEDWGDGSGAVMVEFDTPPSSPVVIGVSCRQSRQMEGSDAVLAMCLDKLELYE